MPLGWACRLTTSRQLAAAFNIPEPAALQLLRDLRVPVYQPPMSEGVYFNLPSLEARLYYLLRPALMPPSRHKIQKPGWAKRHPMVGCLEDPRFRAEWEAVAAIYHDITQKHLADRLLIIRERLSKALEKSNDPQWLTRPPRRKYTLRRRPYRRVYQETEPL